MLVSGAAQGDNWINKLKCFKVYMNMFQLHDTYLTVDPYAVAEYFGTIWTPWRAVHVNKLRPCMWRTHHIYLTYCTVIEM